MEDDIRVLYKRNHGKTIKLGGLSHRIHYREFNAIFPYAHKAIHVSLEPVNKRTSYYQEMRDRLGDDWIVDGLKLEDKDFAEVWGQLIRGQAKSRKAKKR